MALVPSERSFLDAQGLVIAAMACVTGFAVAVAGSGWWNVPITHILWLGVVWAAVICIIDRLIYKSFGTGRRANLMLAVPRAALSVMLALVLGLPMVQFIFKPSIANQIQSDKRPRAEGRAESGDHVLRAEDQASVHADRRDPEQRNDAREPDQQVHAARGLRVERTVLLTHPPHGMRSLVPVLRKASEHRSRHARSQPAGRRGEDRHPQGEDQRVAAD